MENYIKKRDRYRLTNYSKRYKMIRGLKPFLTIRKSNRYIYVQIAKYDPKGDIILWAKSTKNMGLTKGKNCNAAKILGEYCSKNIKHRGIILYTGQIRGFPEFIKSFVRAINKTEKIVIAGDIR